MEFETKIADGPGGKYIKNKHTNEPIAIITNRRPGVNTVAWHPDYLTTHPEISDSLLHRNINQKFYKNHTEAQNKVDLTANRVARGTLDKDPVKTKYAGTEKYKNQYGEDRERHIYNMYDDEENHIGHIRTVSSPSEIEPKSHVEAHLNKDYLEHHNISPSVISAAENEHGGSDALDRTLGRVRYLLDHRNKEPRFIGTETAPKSKTEVYKHKMSPEDASSAYEEALKKNLGDSFKFTRHSPTAFVAHEPPGTSKYSEHKSHTVMSLPGEIHHTTYSLSHPDYDHKNKNTNVVESV